MSDRHAVSALVGLRVMKRFDTFVGLEVITHHAPQNALALAVQYPNRSFAQGLGFGNKTANLVHRLFDVSAACLRPGRNQLRFRRLGEANLEVAGAWLDPTQ